VVLSPSIKLAHTDLRVELPPLTSPPATIKTHNYYYTAALLTAMHLQPMHSHRQPHPLLQAVPLQVSQADPPFCKQLHPLPPADRSTHTSLTLVQSSPGTRVTPCQSADYLHEVWKFLEIRTSEITFAGFSGTIHQTLIWRLPGLPDLFHHT